MKAGEERIADACPSVTVMFSDLVGFTKMSRTKSAEDLVELLGELFSKFDTIIATGGSGGSGGTVISVASSGVYVGFGSGSGGVGGSGGLPNGNSGSNGGVPNGTSTAGIPGAGGVSLSSRPEGAGGSGGVNVPNNTGRGNKGHDGIITITYLKSVTVLASPLPESTVFLDRVGQQTWTVPQGVNSITVTLIGGGGGGGGAYWSGGDSRYQYPVQHGGRGGRGGSDRVTLSVTPGQTFNLIIGDGGIAGASPFDGVGNRGPQAGGNGGDTIFGTITVTGGKGGGPGTRAYTGADGSPKNDDAYNIGETKTITRTRPRQIRKFGLTYQLAYGSGGSGGDSGAFAGGGPGAPGVSGAIKINYTPSRPTTSYSNTTYAYTQSRTISAVPTYVTILSSLSSVDYDMVLQTSDITYSVYDPVTQFKWHTLS